ncbi:hypothetical protein [uncultured Clostridium sp.]|uniref:hypothetical protein n=1 Tax=uncultured Clostridium sp. TaxID=59620 RepID=UPI0027DC8685|nr:hypothetical protein [uncultured Clostridium sp.]
MRKLKKSSKEIQELLDSTEEFKIYEENGSITECNDIDDMINLAKFLLEHGSKDLRLVVTH